MNLQTSPTTTRLVAARSCLWDEVGTSANSRVLTSRTTPGRLQLSLEAFEVGFSWHNGHYTAWWLSTRIFECQIRELATESPLQAESDVQQNAKLMLHSASRKVPPQPDDELAVESSRGRATIDTVDLA
eukprot:5470372-Pleurochrysis_carterae.AAC.5